jgi:hypothetical protein
MQQPDIVRYHQAIALLVPSSAVQRQHTKRPLSDPSADFLQMQVHSFDVGVRQHESGADGSRRADGAGLVIAGAPLIAHAQSAAASRPRPQRPRLHILRPEPAASSRAALTAKAACHGHPYRIGQRGMRL